MESGRLLEAIIELMNSQRRETCFAPMSVTDQLALRFRGRFQAPETLLQVVTRCLSENPEIFWRAHLASKGLTQTIASRRRIVVGCKCRGMNRVHLRKDWVIESVPLGNLRERSSTTR